MINILLNKVYQPTEMYVLYICNKCNKSCHFSAFRDLGKHVKTLNLFKLDWIGVADAARNWTKFLPGHVVHFILPLLIEFLAFYPGNNSGNSISIGEKKWRLNSCSELSVGSSKNKFWLESCAHVTRRRSLAEWKKLSLPKNAKDVWEAKISAFQRNGTNLSFKLKKQFILFRFLSVLITYIIE